LAGKVVIAIDAMGGDHAPRMVIEGMDIARVRHPEARFLLHGDEAVLKPLVAAIPQLASVCDIHHADTSIAMDAKPSQALRQGRDSSMWRAIESVKAGDANAVISAGNTGALMAIAKFQLRTLPGISRPAIAAIWPTMRGDSILLDAGANIEVDAAMLVDFAIMGEAFARAVLGVPQPTVGLLNVGAEALKGTDSVREADRMLREANLPMQYRGFVEGDDISSGTTDVVVADGFTGNIALKTAEGTARLVAHYLSTAIRRSFFARIGAFFAMGALKTMRARLDPRRVNGGTFLGLNGTVVKSHGGTDGFGFASALELAIDMAHSRFAAEITEALEKLAAAGIGGRMAAEDAGSISPGSETTAVS
jgi:glycerol-3-phosphate acyltransferase PlsX